MNACDRRQAGVESLMVCNRDISQSQSGWDLAHDLGHQTSLFGRIIRSVCPRAIGDNSCRYQGIRLWIEIGCNAVEASIDGRCSQRITHSIWHSQSVTIRGASPLSTQEGRLWIRTTRGLQCGLALCTASIAGQACSVRSGLSATPSASFCRVIDTGRRLTYRIESEVKNQRCWTG
jgi:hypothetical protein